MNIGAVVKREREKMGLTQVALAEQTKLSVRTIQRIESDKVNPSDFSIKTICDVLKVDFKEIKSEVEETNTGEQKMWVILLHLSGIFFFLFPPIIIYYVFKDINEPVEKQGKSVINFQINVFLILITLGMLSFLVFPIILIILLSIYSTFKVIQNTIKVMCDKPPKYPTFYKFID